MSFIDAQKIHSLLDTKYEPNKIESILDKALELKCLDDNEIIALLNLDHKDSIQKLFMTSKKLKEKLHGQKNELFASIRISNYCNNNCIYCNFRYNNNDLQRKVLTIDEILEQVEQINKSGCKKILLTAGDNDEMASLEYINQIVQAIKKNFDKITLDLGIAPLSTQQSRQVSSWNIGTYHISQESYHLGAYKRMHTQGPKFDYNTRLYSIDTAIKGGIKDFGLGILLGLYDWRYEVVCVIEHAKYLSNKYGIEPKAVSIPKMESQEGSILSKFPPYMVLDEQFLKIVAVLRLALPHTEIILPAKESTELKRKALELGVTTALSAIEECVLA